MSSSRTRVKRGSPEVAILLALTRGDLPKPVMSSSPGCDIGCLEALAWRHQVSPLCYWLGRGRGEAGPGTLSPDIQRSLNTTFRLEYLRHSARNEILLETIQAIAGEFSAAGVRPLFLKGPYLVFRAYPDPGTRPVGDIDLGIRKDDYERAAAALKSLGYHPYRSLPESAALAARQAFYGRQLRFWHPTRRKVELHFRAVNSGSQQADEEWVHGSTQQMLAGAQPIWVPGPEAMVVQCLLHANQHAFSVLRLLQDVRWLLHSVAGILSWSEVVNRISVLRCRAAAYHALLLARDMAGATVPQAVLDELRPGPLRRAAFRLTWDLGAVRRLDASARHEEMDAPLFHLLEIGGLSDKLNYLRGLVWVAGGSGAFARRAWALARQSRGE